MRIYHWHLRTAGKWLAVASFAAFLSAKLLERVNEVARTRAEGAVDWHVINRHADEEDA